MKNYPYYQNCSNIARALAHPSRLVILDELSRKDSCVTELTRIVESDQTTVSKHLTVLRAAGLIGSVKKGLYVIYFLKKPCVMQFFQCLEKAAQKTKKAS